VVGSIQPRFRVFHRRFLPAFESSPQAESSPVDTLFHATAPHNFDDPRLNYNELCTVFAVMVKQAAKSGFQTVQIVILRVGH